MADRNVTHVLRDGDGDIVALGNPSYSQHVVGIALISRF